MGYSVGQVARFAGITVRTLHHYDEIGLLRPSERSAAGYRRYGEPDLDRLQQVLFYRELGFSLEEIAVILDDPGADPVTHLRRQHELLRRRIGRLETMATDRAITAEAGEVLEAFAAAFAEGAPADGERAMDVAERHRAHITRWFYDCTYEIHEGLGERYVTDPRFAANYERVAEGLSRYVRDAVHANAARHA